MDIKIKEDKIVNKTSQSYSSSKKKSNLSKKKTSNKNTKKIKIQLPNLTNLNDNKGYNVSSQIKDNTLSLRKTEIFQKEFDKQTIDLIKKKDVSNNVKEESKKSVEVSSRNKNKALDNLGGSLSNTFNLVNNINYRNISFIKNEGKASYYISPTKKDNKVPNKYVITKLKKYQNSTKEKVKDEKSGILNFTSFQNNKLPINKLNSTDLRRLASPMKVRVDLNLLVDEKNCKRISIGPENKHQFSKSFHDSDIKLQSNSINKKTFINLACKSFENDKNIQNFTQSKDYLFSKRETKTRKFPSQLKNDLKTQTVLSPSKNLHYSLNMFKQNFNFLNDNRTVESGLDHKKSTKDESTKGILISSNKNDVDSIEDIHFLFVKYIKQSKDKERLNEKSMIPKSCSPNNSLMFEEDLV